MTKKFIFLTGGAKRIGKTSCKHFHDEGFNIIFHYNSSEKEAKEIMIGSNLDENTLDEVSKICMDACLSLIHI